MAEEPDPDWKTAWRSVLWTNALVFRDLERSLMADHGMPITWFDLMNRLDSVPDHRMRMQDLGTVSLFTKGGLTRLVDRIEEAGFVRREASARDRRGVYVVLTDEGSRKLDEVWPDHDRSIYQFFGRHLDHEDAAAVCSALQKVLESYGVDVSESSTRVPID